MSLTSFDANESPAAVVEVLRRDGGVIVRNLAPVELIDACAAQLRSTLDEFDESQRTGFSGRKTLRYGGVLRYAPCCAELIAHAMVLNVADAVLLPSCADYQLGSTTGIEILPGESDQQLHRDDTPYPIQVAGLDLQFGVMWSFNDFTAENGATRVVPGSLPGLVLSTLIVWPGFARRRTTSSRFLRGSRGSTTRESGVSWDIRLMAPVTTSSATTVVTTRSGCSKMKRRPQRAGNCPETSICSGRCWRNFGKSDCETRRKQDSRRRNSNSHGRSFAANKEQRERVRMASVPVNCSSSSLINCRDRSRNSQSANILDALVLPHSALTHACEAAQRGVIDAVIGIAPHLSQSQIDPDEVSAWGLVEASREQQECAGYTGISFQWMKSVISRLNSPTITSNAEALANQYWQEYGAQMLRNSGCVT